MLGRREDGRGAGDDGVGAAAERRLGAPDAARGGVGELVAAKLLQNGYTGRYRVHAIDSILPPCTVDEGMKMTGLDADSIFEAVIESEA